MPWLSSTWAAGPADRVGHGIDHPVTVGSGGHERQARFGAELAGAQGVGADQLPADLVAAFGGRGRGDHHGVEAAEFAEERDRVRATFDDFQQRPAAVHATR